MKKERLEKICELVQRSRIETQEELSRLLLESGFPATQATVSRDIRELRLTKQVGKSGRAYYVLPKDVLTDSEEQDKLIRVLSESFLSCETAGNLLVIRTMSGMAMAAAAALDSLHLEGCLGCIAGDDTIFMAVRTTEDSERIKHHIEVIGK